MRFTFDLLGHEIVATFDYEVTADPLPPTRDDPGSAAEWQIDGDVVLTSDTMVLPKDVPAWLNAVVEQAIYDDAGVAERIADEIADGSYGGPDPDAQRDAMFD